jgi:hypothetical protein
MLTKERLCRWYDFLVQKLLNFNVFQSNFAPTIDQYKIRTQIIATRVYFVLLAVSFFVLIIYTSQVEVTHNVTVKDSTHDQFLSLYNAYSQTLSCPCTTISIPYDQFIYLNASYHQVCESIYTTLAWRQLIDSTSNDTQISLNFRYIGGPLFNVLSSFCYLASTTINDGIVEFNATQFISSAALPLNIFNFETENFIDLFISQTTREFIRSRELIRDQTQYNGLMSGLYTNFYYKVIPEVYFDGSTGYSFPSISRTYVDQSSSCSCEETPFCITPAFIDDETFFHVPGMYFGCYIVESLLQSNLGCFYNQSCIDELRYALNSTVVLNTTALDRTIKSQYALNETIENIVNQLMVEQWFNTTSHKLYYDRCHPVVCTYNYIDKNYWFTILTSIIVPIGGLNLILKIIAPSLIRILRRRRRTEPGMLMILVI